MGPTGQTGGGNGQAPAAATTGNGQAPTGGNANAQNTDTTGTSATPHDGTGNGQAPTGQASTDGAQLTENERRWQQEAAEARREAARHRTELDKLRQAAMTDEEKRAAKYAEMERQNADLLAERQSWLLERAAAREARGLGLEGERLDAALKLMDRAKLETNEDGTPKNLAKLLADTVKDYPFLANGTPAQPAAQAQPAAAQKPAASSGGATNPGAAQSAATSAADVTWQQYAAMSQAERVHPPTWAKITATLARNNGRFPGQP